MRRPNSKGATTEWVLLGCGCFAGLIVIIAIIFVIIYQKANFLASLRYFPAGMGNMGQLKSDCKDIPSNAKDYIDEVNAAAEKYGVDPALVSSVIQQESGWNPKAQSSAGAQGLMQLMPATAAGLGVTDSFDPKQNIDGGTKYLSQLLEQFNGDTTKAIAAYNAGPGAVQHYDGVPPYEETENYVRYVNNNYELFKKCLNQSTGTFIPSVNKNKNTIKLVDQANQGGWGQTGPSDCLDADKRLIKNTFPNINTDNFTSLDQPKSYDRNLPPTDQDLQTASDLLNKGDAVVWYINGEASGQHWIIIVDIDANKNISYLDPNGDGGPKTNSFDYMSTLNDGSQVPFFGRTPSTKFERDAWLRGIYYTP